MKKVKLLLLVCSFILLNTAASAQTRTITGTITDSRTGEPITGATIKVLNSKLGTSAEYVDGGEAFIFQETAEGGFEIIFDHVQ